MSEKSSILKVRGDAAGFPAVAVIIFVCYRGIGIKSFIKNLGHGMSMKTGKNGKIENASFASAIRIAIDAPPEEIERTGQKSCYHQTTQI
jgi:hypothetical protein